MFFVNRRCGKQDSSFFPETRGPTRKEISRDLVSRRKTSAVFLSVSGRVPTRDRGARPAGRT